MFDVCDRLASSTRNNCSRACARCSCGASCTWSRTDAQLLDFERLQQVDAERFMGNPGIVLAFAEEFAAILALVCLNIIS